MNMFKVFSVGDEIKGYCNGYFGRDDYNDKTCVFVTKGYAVFENDDGEGSVINFCEDLYEDSRGWFSGQEG